MEVAVTSRRGRRLRAGWFTADTMIGLAVVLALMLLLGAALTRHERASQRLAESRESMRLAEQVLTAMQSHEAPPTPPAGVKCEITPLDTDAGGKFRWARVSVTRGQRVQTLAGVVPKTSLKG
jgi:hypothetical protein